MLECKTECKVNDYKTDSIREMIDKRWAIMDELQRVQQDKYDIEYEIKSTVIELKLYDCMTINYNTLNKMIK